MFDPLLPPRDGQDFTPPKPAKRRPFDGFLLLLILMTAGFAAIAITLSFSGVQ